METTGKSNFCYFKYIKDEKQKSLNSHSNVIVVKASMNMLTPTDVITQSLENVPSTVVV